MNVFILLTAVAWVMEMVFSTWFRFPGVRQTRSIALPIFGIVRKLHYAEQLKMGHRLLLATFGLLYLLQEAVRLFCISF